MNFSNMFKDKTKRTGIIGAIFAVVTLVSSIRTLKTYLGNRKKKKK